MNRIDKILVIIMLIIVVIACFWLRSNKSECDAKNGLLVNGFGGQICIDAKELK